MATGYTDMRKGFPGLSLMVQEALKRDPMCGHLTKIAQCPERVRQTTMIRGPHRLLTKRLGQPSLRIDCIHLCRLQERRDGRPSPAATVASSE
ncbi:transposase [Rhizobium laguerreae]|uniref:transposase n=1 Tax=Rhizobium laguerreae TaxID=1076926 RepID=UPI0021B15088|nr:transposase [Rhizobium laguerreae]